MPAVLQRPHSLGPQTARPSSAVVNPRSPTSMVRSLSSSSVAAATAATVCELLCMSAPTTIIALCPFLAGSRSGHPADTACLRARPRSYQVTPRHPEPATSDTAKASQTNNGRQRESESARRRSGPSPQRRTSPTASIRTASVKAAVALDRFTGPFSLDSIRPRSTQRPAST